LRPAPSLRLAVRLRPAAASRPVAAPRARPWLFAAPRARPWLFAALRREPVALVREACPRADRPTAGERPSDWPR
jgi:hypothetical protein